MDPRERRLETLTRQIARRLEQARALETERNKLLSQLAANGDRGILRRLATLTQLSPGRITQIVQAGNAIGEK